MSAHSRQIQMKPPPANTTETQLVSLVHASKSLLHLKQIHAHLLRRDLAGSSHVITQLVAACAPLRSMPYALSLFRRFPSPTPYLFNALIRALADTSLFAAAASHFVLMSRSGLRPAHLAFPFALRSAASLLAPALATSLHAAAAKDALDLDPFVRTSLVDTYVKLGSSDLALRMFDETPERHKATNVLLWNVSINGCCRSGDMSNARKLFDSMPEKTMASWNSLIHGFMRKGDLEEAVRLFDQMPDRNVISWTTMVAGFSQNGDNKHALGMFDRMLEAGVRPNAFTVASTLSACSRMGALDGGVRIHEYALRNGFQMNGAIGTALVDMYSKCGRIDRASEIFDQMSHRDLLTWTAMIMGFAIHGDWRQALQCFEGMKCACVEPDEGVFLALLMACSHSGKVERGIELFDRMRFDYKIQPTMKHYTCMVDLFGRAGRLIEALDFIESMPIEPDFILWGALFSACRAHKNVPLAELAAEKLLKLKPAHSGSYIFLSNIYAGSARWEDAEKVRISMKNRCVEKSPGWSSIEVEGIAHHFVAGDRIHPHLEEIYKRLEDLSTRAREDGYRPSTEWVLHNIEEEDKEGALEFHSEKLALAFGLLSTPEGADIRIVKNLRVCGDCHSLMKFASRICRREIMLRDIKRFHHFRDGECSCCDYW